MGRKKRPMGRPVGTGKFTHSDGERQVTAPGYRRVIFYADDGMMARIKAVAALEGVTLSEKLNRIIANYLKGVKIKI